MADLATQDPKPILPGQAPIGVSSQAVDTAAKTVTNQINSLQLPSNVSGGDADFSALTTSLMQIVDAKKSELSAGVEALQNNAKVTSVAQDQISKLTDASLSAYDNLKKASALPGGADGDIAQIYSIFNSDYNTDFQKQSILENQARASQIKDTAAALIEQNNSVPALMGKVSQAASEIFTAQKDANTLFIEGGKLKNAEFQTKLDAARLGIEMSKENREALTFKINGMSMDQIAQQIPLAKAGKGPFKGAAGFLEERLMQEQSAMASLDNIQNAAKKGDREEYNAAQVDFSSKLPVDMSAQLLSQAQKSGAAVVTVPLGKGPDGKPITQDIPISLFQEGILKAGKTQDDVNAYLAADFTQRLNIIPNATNLMNVAQAFTRIDPRAGQLAMSTASIMQHLDAKDPSSVRQVGILLEKNKEAMDKIVSDNAARMSTPEAKAAVITYGKTGHFDAVGGQAVVADSVNIPALANNGLYKSAWQTLATQVMTEAKSQSLVSGTNFDPNSTADQQQFFAQILSQSSGKASLSQIIARTLADPKNQAAVRNSVKATLQTKSVNDTLTGLASQKNANPIWRDLLQHPEQLRGQDGKVNIGLMFDKFEAETVKSGGKMNYGQMFLGALKNYGLNAPGQGASDPSYTWQDHALEGSIFGDSSPIPAIVGDLHWQLSQASQRAHAEMQKRINQDVSDMTQRNAVMRADVIFEEQPRLGLTFDNHAAIKKQTGVDMSLVPSATGTGLTADQIKRMYGGGQ